MTNITARVGERLSLTADSAAQMLGLTKPNDQTWEFDTVRSSVPPGVTLGWNSLSGVIDKDSEGAYAVQVFYSQNGVYREITPMTILVLPPLGPHYVTLPTPAELLTHLGWSSSARNSSLATAHLEHVTELARAYTRGRGFDGDKVEASIRAVIIGAAARSVSNPSNAYRIEAGSVVATPARLEGFTLAEQTALNRFRVRVA